MVADMIAASGIGVDLAFGEYEILYPGINFEYIGMSQILTHYIFKMMEYYSVKYMVIFPK